MENSQIVPLKLNGLRVEVRPVEGKEAQLLQLEKAMKIFKKKLEKDGVLFEAKERRYYTKDSVKIRTAYKKLHPKKKRIQTK
jgi:ribosomal protein S21